MRRNRQNGPGGMIQDASDIVLIMVLGLIAVAAIATWLTGQVAALFFYGRWPSVSVGQALAAAWRLPGDLGDPRLAWPASARGELPGAVGFLVAGVVALIIVTGIALILGRIASRFRSQRGFAGSAEIRSVLSEKAVIARGPVVRPSLRRRSR